MTAQLPVAEPHLSELGRDPPDYRYLARRVVVRNKIESIAFVEGDIRRELQAAYERGRADALERRSR